MRMKQDARKFLALCWGLGLELEIIEDDEGKHIGVSLESEEASGRLAELVSHMLRISPKLHNAVFDELSRLNSKCRRMNKAQRKIIAIHGKVQSALELLNNFDNLDSAISLLNEVGCELTDLNVDLEQRGAN